MIKYLREMINMKNNEKNIISIRIVMIISLLFYLLIAFFVDAYINNLMLLNTIMIIVTILFILFISIIFRIELEIINYECKNCKHIFKPKYKNALLAPHIGTIRYLKCPKCNENHWNKRILKEK